jgi:hypothetical protein
LYFDLGGSLSVASTIFEIWRSLFMERVELMQSENQINSFKKFHLPDKKYWQLCFTVIAINTDLRATDILALTCGDVYI